MGCVFKATSRFLYFPERPGIRCTGGWTDPRAVWTGAENNATTGIRYPDLPGRSESLYRLSYPGILDYVTMIFHLQLCTVE
jgi:hypothetical protein